MKKLKDKSAFLKNPVRKILSDRYKDLIILWILGIIWIFLSLVMPDEVGKITRLFSDSQEVKWDMVLKRIVIMVSAQVALSFIVYLRIRMLDLLLEKNFKSLVMEVFSRILRFNEEFFRKYEIEKINVRIFDDSRVFSDFYSSFLGDISIEIACVIIFSIFMIIKSWPLALAVILASFLLSYVIFFDSKIQKTTLEIQENLETARTKSNEVLSNIWEIRSNTIFDYVELKLQKALDKLYRVKIECSKLTSLFTAMGPMVRNIQFAGLYSLGAWLCINGAILYSFSDKIVWGDVIQFAIIAQIFQVRVGRVAQFFIQWRLVNQNIIRIKDYLKNPLTFINTIENPPQFPVDKDIIFENVTVCPAKNLKILDKINLNIESGKHIAFAGPSGSGKSTLLSLITRDNKPSAGKIKIGANSLHNYDINSMGKDIGVVYQKASILNTSIRNNLLLGLRRSHGSLKDREGPIDGEKLNIKTIDELNSKLLNIIRLVGLEEDIFEKFIGTSLPLETDPAYKENLISIGSSVIKEISKIDKELILKFDFDSLIPGTLFENLMGPGFNVNRDFEENGLPLYRLLKENDLIHIFLKAGYNRFISEYTIKMSTSIPDDLIKAVLTTQKHLEEKEELFTYLKSQSLENFPENLKIIFFKIALEIDIKKIIININPCEFKNNIIKSRKIIRDKYQEKSNWKNIQERNYIDKINVRENLLMGRININIENSVKTVNSIIKEILKENNLINEALLIGLEFRTGEGGKFLSGGQKQKIAIGRTILKEPDILIMDEATASLDEASQSKIVNLIKDKFSGKTVITVSHRLSTIKNYDNIFVLDRGRIVENGDYSSLVASGGMFHHLVKEEGKGNLSAITGLVMDVMEKGEITFTEDSKASCLLYKCPLFSHINRLHLAYIQRIADISPQEKGDIIYKPGDKGDKLYIIFQGEVDLFSENEKESKIFQSLSPVEIFGEGEIISGEKRKTGAIIKSDAILCIIDRDNFLDIMAADNQMAISFAKLVSKRLISLQENFFKDNN